MRREDFRYVEFASRGLRGFRNRVVSLDRLPDVIAQRSGYDCFSSYYLFDDGLIDHVKERKSVGGYRGPCYARVVHLDLDAGDLGCALQAARELCAFMLDYWGADQESIFPYFSGSKGFHIGLHAGVFGEMEPSEELPDVLYRLQSAIVSQAKLKDAEVVDYSVGRRLSLLRLPNTRHSASGLYKVPLTLHELMNEPPEGLRAIARQPRESYFCDATGLIPLTDVKPLPDAADLFLRCVGEVKERQERDLPPPESFLGSRSLTEALCDAELVLYYEGVPEGARSWTTLRLASRMRCAGYPEDETKQMLLNWNRRNWPPMEEREVARIVDVAYRAEVPYQFGCGNGQTDSPATALVYRACPYRDRMKCSKYRVFASYSR